MVKELIVVADIMKPYPDKQGKPVLLKRNCEYLKQFELTNILAEQVLDSKGNISKKYSLIKEGDNFFKVKMKYEDLCKLNSRVIVKGFIS